MAVSETGYQSGWRRNMHPLNLKQWSVAKLLGIWDAFGAGPKTIPPTPISNTMWLRKGMGHAERCGTKRGAAGEFACLFFEKGVATFQVVQCLTHGEKHTNHKWWWQPLAVTDDGLWTTKWTPWQLCLCCTRLLLLHLVWLSTHLIVSHGHNT